VVGGFYSIQFSTWTSFSGRVLSRRSTESPPHGCEKSGGGQSAFRESATCGGGEESLVPNKRALAGDKRTEDQKRRLALDPSVGPQTR